MSKIKAVVFDLDDTLYPEYDYVMSGFAVVAKELKRQFDIENAESEMTRLFSENVRNVFGRLLDFYGIRYEKSDIEHLASVYREHEPSISLPDESVRTLEDLRRVGYKLGIVTDGRAFQQRNKIAALGLDGLVDEIVVTDELGGAKCEKPNPQAFEKVMSALGTDAAGMMYVGDNPKKDFAVKKYLPVTTVRVMRGLYADCDYADGILPDFTVDSLRQITGILDGLC